MQNRKPMKASGYHLIVQATSRKSSPEFENLAEVGLENKKRAEV